MRAPLVHIGLTALALVSLAACTDKRDLLAPPKASSILQPIGGIVDLPPTRPPLIDRSGYWVEITAGDYHTCARKFYGNLYCWGRDIEGQLGIDAPELCWGEIGMLCARQPTYVSYMTATKIDAGSSHTCALDPNAAAWCWGSNSLGQLGSRANVGGKASRPERVSGGLVFAALGAGDNATCGALTVGGLYCWGNRAPSPTFVAGGGFSEIAVAGDHSCGNTGNNEWFCWGSNNLGQIAVDPQTRSSIPPYEWVHSVDGASHVSVSGGYTCAAQASGLVQCFGLNDRLDGNLVHVGLLGNPQFTGTFTHLLQTVGQSPNGLPLLHLVTTSATHSCATDWNGAAFCWGEGDANQLGDGRSLSSTAPVQVAGGHTFIALAAGVDHTCGIGTDNHIYCWGDNNYGQLGRPDRPELPGARLYGSPVPVQARDP